MIVEGKVSRVFKDNNNNLKHVVLESGQSYPTSYHTLDELNRYIGQEVTLDLSPRNFIYSIQKRLDIEEISPINLSTISLEIDLQRYYEKHINEIEPNLALVDGGIEYRTDVGFIDLLAKDSLGNFVVIELKVGKADDAALGQLLGYIGCIHNNNNQTGQTRGILIASDFDKRIVSAVKNLSHIKLIQYQVSFQLNDIAR